MCRKLFDQHEYVASMHGEGQSDNLYLATRLHHQQPGIRDIREIPTNHGGEPTDSGSHVAVSQLVPVAIEVAGPLILRFLLMCV